MKDVKIRFVGCCDNADSEPRIYFIQKKSLFGWRYIKGCDGKAALLDKRIYGKEKEVLLQAAISIEGWTRSKCTIVEYPTIKRYL